MGLLPAALLQAAAGGVLLRSLSSSLSSPWLDAAPDCSADEAEKMPQEC
jgi:hypothetical protein